MQDVLIGVHSCASATDTKLTQLTEIVTASYKSMVDHEAGKMCKFSLHIFVSQMHCSYV